jgi:GNAT superfamily N-acetyltransferase
MTNISIRPLQGEEFLDVHYNFSMYAFRPSPPFPDKEESTKIVRERKGVTYHALFEDGKAVAGAASMAMTQNVRGKLFPASGIFGVVTLPAARRKGYSRQVMASLLSAEKEAGKVFSNLYPFRESFYERLGYVTFPLPIIARLLPSALAPLLGKNLNGEVELKLISEAFDTYRDYLAKMRPQVHGMALFDTGDKAAAGRNKLWVALARVDGEIFKAQKSGNLISALPVFIPPPAAGVTCCWIGSPVILTRLTGSRSGFRSIRNLRPGWLIWR